MVFSPTKENLEEVSFERFFFIISDIPNHVAHKVHLKTIRYSLIGTYGLYLKLQNPWKKRLLLLVFYFIR